MKYEDLKRMDLKEYQVPMLLSEKLFQYAQRIEEDADSYAAMWVYEMAQHALQLEDMLDSNKETDHA